MLKSVTAAPPSGNPGRSGHSVGHLAKAAVEEARDAGLAVPKNATGFAASRITQGVDPASLFAALAVPDTAGITPEPDVLVDEADNGTTSSAQPTAPQPDTMQVSQSAVQALQQLKAALALLS